MKSKKGSQFEREMCEELSEWWSGGKRDDIFWRSSGSGARAKVRGRKGKKTHGQHGDIAAVHPSGEKLIKLFTIELKRGYSKHTIYDVADKEHKAAQQEWEKWFEQINESQKQSGTKGWMIIHRRDRRIPFVFFSFSLYQMMFNEISRIPRPYLIMYLTIRNSKKEKEDITVFGCSLKQFMNTVSPETVKNLYQRLKKEKLDKKNKAEEFPETQKKRNKNKG